MKEFFLRKYLTVLSCLQFSQKKKALSQMFDWVENRLLAKGLKYLALLLPAYKLNRKNTQPENMCEFLKRRKVMVRQ